MTSAEVDTTVALDTVGAETLPPFSISRLEGTPLSTVEELWKIFTYYTMHTNASQPEILKITNIMQFLRDTQIINRGTDMRKLELEIIQCLRKHRPADFDYRPTVAFNFREFLHVVDHLALLTYPKHDPEVAVRRLLLENILMLASRRVATSFTKFPNASEGIKIVGEKFADPLENIFNHYAWLTTQRRFLKAAAAAASAVNSGQQPGTESPQPKKKQNVTLEVDYQDFIQFCADFKLKSKQFLSAIQIGDVFLACVKLNETDFTLKGMKLEKFFEALVRMASLAYRHLGDDFDIKKKVKAMLVHMWKAVNSSEICSKAVAARGSSSSVLHSGSLNTYGSGPFTEQFLKAWQAEGFPDYILPEEQVTSKGVAVLQRIIISAKQKKPPLRIENMDAPLEIKFDVKLPAAVDVSGVSEPITEESVEDTNPTQVPFSAINVALPPPVAIPRGPLPPGPPGQVAPPPRGGPPPPAPAPVAAAVSQEVETNSPPLPPPQPSGRRASLEEKLARSASLLSSKPPPPRAPAAGGPPPPPITASKLEKTLEEKPELVEMLLCEMKSANL